MAQDEQPKDSGQRWKYGISGLIVTVGLGLVVYITVRTGEIPYITFGPMLAAALAALLGFKASDWRK